MMICGAPGPDHRTVIGADGTLNETVDRIMLDTGLAGLPGLEH